MFINFSQNIHLSGCLIVKGNLAVLFNPMCTFRMRYPVDTVHLNDFAVVQTVCFFVSLFVSLLICLFVSLLLCEGTTSLIISTFPADD